MIDKKTILFTFLISFSSFTLFGQQIEKNKSNVSKNWMVVSVKQKGKTAERDKEPYADFVLSQDGTYSIRFENVGAGTWRLVDDFIILHGKQRIHNDMEKTMVQAVLKILSLEKEKIKVQIITETKYYDWELTMVPFN